MPALPLARCALAALTGILAFLSFPTHSLYPLIFVALVPLMVGVFGTSPRRAFALGWVAGVVGHLGAFGWVLATIARFEQISTLAALPFFSVFVAYQALQFALFAGGVALASPQRFIIHHSPLTIQHCCGVAAWWVLLEWSFPKILPWSFGWPLADSPLLRQAADLGGVYGLSLFVALVNACVTAALLQSGTPLWQRLRPVGFAAALVALATLYGAMRLGDSRLSTQNSESVRKLVARPV